MIWPRENALFVPTPTVEVEGATPDPDDDYLVGLALSFRATFVVSGNTSHFPLGSGVRGVEFVSPRGFVDFLLRERR